ncbi:TerD family protein [Actinoplanes subtropicus]|uniref:TerD family protein n=1 Tax=Actinoplanes subtropicus TaxID=543632 RepID=UPI0004C32B64|nr:TerD family protein [Actinoplanes subtropicus]
MRALTAVPDHRPAGPVVEVTGADRPFALLLDARGRVTSEFDLVFPGLPTHPSGAARCAGTSLRLTLDAAGAGIRRIAVGVLRDPTAAALVRLDIDGTPFTAAAEPGEPMVVLADFVRDAGGKWRYRRAGYGLASGARLTARFRAEPDGALQRRLDTFLDGLAPAPIAATARPASSPRPAAGLLVGHVSLDRGEVAAVPRTGEAFHAALNWNRHSKDLDLYALYIDRDGRSGACYYRHLGSLTAPPYVCLTSGDRRGRETIEVSHAGHLRYVLICAYSALSNGIGSFASFGAFAEIDNGSGSVVQVPLHHRNRYSYWVAIALVDLSAADRIAVRHVERYSARRSEARPALYRDGTFQMDAGPVEFKTGGYA